MSTVVVDKTVSIPERATYVDTLVDLKPSQRVVLQGGGSIWAGVWFTGWNGPQGWNTVSYDPKFPLPGAHPFSLIANLGMEMFEVGFNAERPYKPGSSSGANRLLLRTNDDTPGNGQGAFSCRIQVWQD
jgi:hypothetical protein